MTETDRTVQVPVALPTREQIASIAYQHVTHTTIWGGSGKHGWKCSCGVHDWGTSVENPERYRQYDTREAAQLSAAEHVADAVRALLSQPTPTAETCICTLGPDTDGPNIDCPVHGLPPRIEDMAPGERLAYEVGRTRGMNEAMDALEGKS